MVSPSISAGEDKPKNQIKKRAEGREEKHRRRKAAVGGEEKPRKKKSSVSKNDLKADDTAEPRRRRHPWAPGKVLIHKLILLAIFGRLIYMHWKEEYTSQLKGFLGL